MHYSYQLQNVILINELSYSIFIQSPITVKVSDSSQRKTVAIVLAALTALGVPTKAKKGNVSRHIHAGLRGARRCALGRTPSAGADGTVAIHGQVSADQTSRRFSGVQERGAGEGSTAFSTSAPACPRERRCAPPTRDKNQSGRRLRPELRPACRVGYTCGPTRQ